MVKNLKISKISKNHSQKMKEEINFAEKIQGG